MVSGDNQAQTYPGRKENGGKSKWPAAQVCLAEDEPYATKKDKPPKHQTQFKGCGSEHGDHLVALWLKECRDKFITFSDGRVIYEIAGQTTLNFLKRYISTPLCISFNILISKCKVKMHLSDFMDKKSRKN